MKAPFEGSLGALGKLLGWSWVWSCWVMALFWGSLGVLLGSWGSLGKLLGWFFAGLGGDMHIKRKKCKSVRNPPPTNQRFTGAPATSETFFQHLVGLQ